MDILQKLRASTYSNMLLADLPDLLTEAAAEIERLRSQVPQRPNGYYWVRLKIYGVDELLPCEPAEWRGDHWELIGCSDDAPDVAVVVSRMEPPQDND